MHALLLPSNGQYHASPTSITAELNKGYVTLKGRVHYTIISHDKRVQERVMS
jgi:hypothetical protein